MQPMDCAAPGCTAPASFRQLEPVDPEAPLYFCVRHWNEFRILNPEKASLFGSLRLLGPLPLAGEE